MAAINLAFPPGTTPPPTHTTPPSCSKLFKEYAIADLTRYKEGRVGLRWRTQREVVSGRGQFSCGATVSAGGHRAAPGTHNPCLAAAEPGAKDVRAASHCSGSAFRIRFRCPDSPAQRTTQTPDATPLLPGALQGCEERRGLASFEVPFAYQEAGERAPGCLPPTEALPWAPDIATGERVLAASWLCPSLFPCLPAQLLARLPA